jgi:hypothetical protein
MGFGWNGTWRSGFGADGLHIGAGVDLVRLSPKVWVGLSGRTAQGSEDHSPLSCRQAVPCVGRDDLFKRLELATTIRVQLTGNGSADLYIGASTGMVRLVARRREFTLLPPPVVVSDETKWGPTIGAGLGVEVTIGSVPVFLENDLAISWAGETFRTGVIQLGIRL